MTCKPLAGSNSLQRPRSVQVNKKRPGPDQGSGEGKMKKQLMRLWKEEEGQDTVEYALLLVLISLVAIIAMSNVGVAANAVFSNAAANLAT
jgi:Flp pilus assembly pilin Flp